LAGKHLACIPLDEPEVRHAFTKYLGLFPPFFSANLGRGRGLFK